MLHVQINPEISLFICKNAIIMRVCVCVCSSSAKTVALAVHGVGIQFFTVTFQDTGNADADVGTITSQNTTHRWHQSPHDTDAIAVAEFMLVYE